MSGFGLPILAGLEAGDQQLTAPYIPPYIRTLT